MKINLSTHEEENINHIPIWLQILVFVVLLFLSVTLYQYNRYHRIKIQTPESVAYDETNKSYYVSCVGVGEVYRVEHNEKPALFVRGLSTPRGLLLEQDTLFAATGNSLTLIPTKDASLRKTILIPGSQMLNDICSDMQNHLYITDTFGNKIYRYDRLSGGITVLCDSLLDKPNGIYFDNLLSRLVVVSFKSNAPIQAVDPLNGLVTTILPNAGDNLDGISRDNEGNWYVSSWKDEAVYRFKPDFSGKKKSIARHLNAPADISYVSSIHSLMIPLLEGNKVLIKTLSLKTAKLPKS